MRDYLLLLCYPGNQRAEASNDIRISEAALPPDDPSFDNSLVMNMLRQVFYRNSLQIYPSRSSLLHHTDPIEFSQFHLLSAACADIYISPRSHQEQEALSISLKASISMK
ncbi:hypothetical protein HYFRA_00012964 [Hymenoscyphus fraxineus]|uniref:Uncharacterized protein n=1 Tax=Hymenoscyphus fraxineus TaxID=746836 RepID=A0A9N9L5V7_9HELO|nr:hypothetical protein HYFRA_00012964 [Hymenoscyphus fraxineus]